MKTEALEIIKQELKVVKQQFKRIIGPQADIIFIEEHLKLQRICYNKIDDGRGQS